MGYEDRPGLDTPEIGTFAAVRLASWIRDRMRPAQGWIVLMLVLLLAALPTWAMRTNQWLRSERTHSALILLGICAVLWVWWLGGWARAVTVRRFRPATIVFLAVVTIFAGLLVLSLLLVRWLPTPQAFFAAIFDHSADPVVADANASIARFQSRLAVWWLAANSGGGARDEVVFALFAGAVIWIVATLAAALTRHFRQGLAAVLPILVLVGGIVYYGGNGRLVFLTALAAGLALQIAQDDGALRDVWLRRRLDYSSDIFVDRWLNAVGVCAAALLVAGMMPSLSLQRIADAFGRLVAPIDERVETVRKQAFANVETAERYSMAGTVTGLPNDFLLGAGPELQTTRILQLRSSDAASSYDGAPPDVYLRAIALSEYDGRGWIRPREVTRTPLAEYERRPVVEGPYRRMLAQTIRLYRPSRLLFAAGEPVEASVMTWDERDAHGELVSIAAGAGSYTVVSDVPAIDDPTLRALPYAKPEALPPGFAAYLALPDSVTPRTRELAATLTAHAATPFEAAQAIESYLRRFPYDTSIGAPPAEIADVADYFLFDLQRGYCDYYATAFVVLARAAGLPARFVAGYAPGSWQPNERSWNVTAADSHAWPEVWFPDVGWIAFEPTASRPVLTRAGNDALPPATAAVIDGQPAPVSGGIDWNWQMLAWLAPVFAIAWGAWVGLNRWRAARADPWMTLQAWGAARGRPQRDSETPAEYGDALAQLAGDYSGRSGEAARIVAREAVEFGRDVSLLRYAPESRRADARTAVMARWTTLRDTLPRLRRHPRRLADRKENP